LHLCAFALCLSSPASGVEFDGQSTTYFNAAQNPTDGVVHTQVPGYEFVTVHASELHTPVGDLSILVSGWGSADLDGHRTYLGPGGDLNLGYIEGSLLDQRLSFRVGRQLVTDGTARMQQVDGANIRYLIGAGVGVEGWGGAIVVPKFATLLGDAMGGGRLFWRPNFSTEIGASYTQVFDRGQTARQEVGIDGRAVVARVLTFTAAAFYDPMAQRFSEAHADATWQIIRGLAITGRWELTAPDLFLPQDSIWSVFEDNEQRDQVGGVIVWSPVHHLSVYGEYYRIFGSNGEGYETSGRVAWAPRFYTIGCEVRALRYIESLAPVSYAANGNVTPRLYVILRPGRAFTLSADVQESELAQEVNGQLRSWEASGSAAWSFVRDWRLVVGILGGVTPFLEQQVQVMGKLEWTPSIRTAEAKP
jgi:hypothetical protein